jgi:hypothetical protein
MKYLIVAILLLTSLFSAQKPVVNIKLGTVDIDEVLLKTDNMIKKYNFKKIKYDKTKKNQHQKIVDTIIANLKRLQSIEEELKLNYIDIKRYKQDLETINKDYNRAINRIYKTNSSLNRDIYILVAHKGDIDYQSDIESYILDKFSIKKYDQTTTLKKSMASKSMQNTIKTEKDFGQKSSVVVDEFAIRAKDVEFNLIKITQNPFIKSKTSQSSNAIVKTNDMFSETGVMLYDLKDTDINTILDELSSTLQIDTALLKQFLQKINNDVNVPKYKQSFAKSSQEIKQVLQTLEEEHQKIVSRVFEVKDNLEQRLSSNNFLEALKKDLFNETQTLLLRYNINLTPKNITNMIIISPKIYSERVYLGEEREYVHRKVKSYISKINITDLQQSETLTNFTDLSSKTKNVHKTVKFETLHILPYIDKNNKIGLFVFSSISIKEELSDSDIVKIPFKYTTLNFIPVKQGYKTIFVGDSEVTLGLVKEFLKGKKTKKYFDTYCIEDSELPEEAKDFKNIDKEYYNYPAVCFKVDKIDKFLKWVGKKAQRDIVIPQFDDWKYIATNSDSSDYCWGNKSLDELIEDEEKPENIYFEDSDDSTTIKEVKKFPKSKTGVYDMCGNIYEMVYFDGELSFAGNSYSSYIAKSDAEPEAYNDDINPSLGLRLFYIKNLGE